MTTLHNKTSAIPHPDRNHAQTGLLQDTIDPEMTPTWMQLAMLQPKLAFLRIQALACDPDQGALAYTVLYQPALAHLVGMALADTEPSVLRTRAAATVAGETIRLALLAPSRP